jgi:glutathione S-transferase
MRPTAVDTDPPPSILTHGNSPISNADARRDAGEDEPEARSAIAAHDGVIGEVRPAEPLVVGDRRGYTDRQPSDILGSTTMAKPVVYGPAYSTFTRTCRMALEEKGVDYDLVEVDMLNGAHKQPEHLARNPFGKVPAFQHGNLGLYETSAITRYVDEAFDGPALEPADAAGKARSAQAFSIIEGYGYGPMIGRIFMQRAVMPMMGQSADEEMIAGAVPEAEACLAALETLIDGNTHLAGDSLSRADLLLVPIYDYMTQIPEGQKVLAAAPNLARWWQTMQSRPSVVKTKPQL